jgi:hypothetical protein
MKNEFKDGIVHIDSPVSRKNQIWVVGSEEMMVVKKEIIFAHACTWNGFIQSQATCLPILEWIEGKLPSQSEI